MNCVPIDLYELAPELVYAGRQREFMLVEISEFLNAHARDFPNFHVRRGNAHEIKGRIDRAKKHLKNVVEGLSSEKLRATQINFVDGKVNIPSGRHRIIAALECGFTHVPVEIESSEKASLQKILPLLPPDSMQYDFISADLLEAANYFSWKTLGQIAGQGKLQGSPEQSAMWHLKVGSSDDPENPGEIVYHARCRKSEDILKHAQACVCRFGSRRAACLDAEKILDSSEIGKNQSHGIEVVVNASGRRGFGAYSAFAGSSRDFSRAR